MRPGSVTNSETLTVLSNVSATQLIGLTNCPGSTATFSTTPSGSGPFTRVWRKDGNVLSGQTNNTLTLPLVTSASAGIYSVTVSGACSSVPKKTTNASRRRPAAKIQVTSVTRIVKNAITRFENSM